MSSKTKSFEYDVHPSMQLMRSMIAGMKQKTGRTVEEWGVCLNQECGAGSAGERTAWLKEKHGLGTNYAKWLAERSLGIGENGDPKQYLRMAHDSVEKMFAGPKAGLVPIYEELLQVGRGLGDDVKVCPCGTIVPLYRRHVFAQIKPTTKTRIDLGLALKDTKAPKQLIDTGGFAKKDRITHRIEIGAVGDIDAEVKRWIRVAYEMDG